MNKSTIASVIAVALSGLLISGCTSTENPSPPPTSPAATPTPSATEVIPTPEPDPEDPDAPAGQCADDSLAVDVAPAEGGAGAGNLVYEVSFTNTGSAECELRGYPGVSVVGNGDGTQLGVPAERVGTTPIETVLVAAGSSVSAALQVSNLDGGGGAVGCETAPGDGWRIYPPHSFTAIFVEDPALVACTDESVFLRLLGPVR